MSKTKLIKVMEAWCPECGKLITEERGYFWLDEDVKCPQCDKEFKV